MEELVSPKLEKLLDQLVAEKDVKNVSSKTHLVGKREKKRKRVERNAGSDTKKLLSSVISRVVKKEESEEKFRGSEEDSKFSQTKSVEGLEDILLEDK